MFACADRRVVDISVMMLATTPRPRNFRVVSGVGFLSGVAIGDGGIGGDGTLRVGEAGIGAAVAKLLLTLLLNLMLLLAHHLNGPDSAELLLDFRWESL